MTNGKLIRTALLSTISLGSSVAFAATAQAQTDAGDAGGSGLGEIVVTAQKREQSTNDVGLSITSLSGELLERRDVADPFDVAKLVPALSVSRVGTSATTVFTLRGIGFNSAFLGASPTVAVYVDEVPLAYPAMTQGAVLDLDRLEVYKGPQGIFFGQNATAGAINFIAAKPTDEFEAGIEASYGRFDRWDASAYVSGPLGDGVNARLAVKHEGGGAWQKSYTRDDTIGKRDRSAGRLLIDLEPSDTVRMTVGLSAWRDRSDAQALQLTKVVPKIPSFLNPELASYPFAPNNARAADWETDKNFEYNTEFWQPSLRAEFDLNDSVTLTSLTSYSDYRTDSLIDNDGTNLQINSHRYLGSIKSLSQELRFAGSTGPLVWTVGGNFSDDRVENSLNQFTLHASNTQNVAGTGLSIGEAPVGIEQDSRTWAAFASGELELSEQFSIVAGGRYTDSTIKFRGCNLGQGYDPIPDTPIPGITQDIEGIFNILYQAFSGNAGVNPIERGGCITLDSLSGTFLPTDSPQTLAEDNIAWNVTLNFKPNDDVLLYALASQGYKSGSFPIFGAATNEQYLPARQEKVIAYEAGFKLTLLDRTLQLDGAGFYYDYTDKQLSGFLLDPIFGPLETLVNIPKSEVVGAEVAAAWVPTPGLSVNAGATYIKTKIKRFEGFDAAGTVQDFAGERFNLSPKWFANLDVSYDWSVNETVDAFIGAGLVYRGSTSSTIGGNDPAFDIDSYALIDAQAGIRMADSGWSAKIWGKNITNKYYWNNTSFTSDNITRVAGMPATYGVTLGYDF